MKPAGDESKKVPRVELPSFPPPGAPATYTLAVLTSALRGLDPLLWGETAPDTPLTWQPILLGIETPSETKRLLSERGIEMEWEDPSFWKAEAQHWRKAGEFDLVMHANFLVQLWKVTSDARGHALRSVVSLVILEDCKVRRELAKSGRLHPWRKQHAFYILERFYRLESQPPMAKFETPPEQMPDYPRALLSAKDAAWKKFGKDCEKFWIETIGLNMVKAGLRKKKPPTKRIRRATRFHETSKAFLIGNWIRCHLWLMTPDVRWMFVRNHWKRPAKKKAVTLEGVNAAVKNAELWPSASPPITGMKKDGRLILNPKG